MSVINWLALIALVCIAVIASVGLTFWEWILLVTCCFCIGLLLCFIYINWYGVPSVLNI